jgi:CheY-like chemotaxis protein
MGGEINVESEFGNGSTFSFTMCTEVGIKVLKLYTQYNLSDQEGKKILVVDDNMTNRAILKNQLEGWKLVPVLASSGEEALKLLSGDSSFSLVLTDMQMPFMDGMQLAEAIRKNAPVLPIILLSSMGDEYNASNLKIFHSILTKPVRQHILCKHILSALQDKKQVYSDQVTVQEKLSNEFALEHPLEILIAEDNPVNQQVIVHILQRMGYEAEVVENGVEAVKAAGRKAFDVILMDMQMPEMDGLEASRTIRATLLNQPVIIALTANTMKGDEEECLNSGMNDYLPKPIKLEELVQKLEKWSNHRSAGECAA